MSRIASIAAALLLAIPALSLARNPGYEPKDPKSRELATCMRKCTDKITSCSNKCFPKKGKGAKEQEQIEDMKQNDPSVSCMQTCQKDASRCMESCSNKK